MKNKKWILSCDKKQKLETLKYEILYSNRNCYQNYCGYVEIKQLSNILRTNYMN